MTIAQLWQQGFRRLGTRHARVVESVTLGMGTRLLVVEFGGQRLLLGQGRHGLTRLAGMRLP